MSATHSIVIPAPISINSITLGVPGIVINDTFAASNPGSMTVNVSCNNGTILLPTTTTATVTNNHTKRATISGSLMAINFCLAGMQYALTQPLNDIITVDVWNQAGVEYQATIPINYNIGTATATPTPTTTTTTTTTTVTSTGSVPSDSTGITARRSYDLLSNFGCNTFSNGQDGAGANASAAAHITGLKYICGNSGAGLLCREYIYDAAAQTTYCEEICNALPGTHWTVCATTVASVSELINLLSNAKGGSWLRYVEGINEPNNTASFGFGATSPAQCASVQQQLYAAAHALNIPVLAPSVANLTGSANFVSDYFGNTGATENSYSDLYNCHYYPNNSAPNNQLSSFLAAEDAVFGSKPGLITEFHPTLYNATQDETTGAYYTIIALLSSFSRFNCRGLIWFCFYDYTGFSPAVGLFHGFDPTAPRTSAVFLRNLYQLLADTGSSKASFAPGKLNISITGLPAGFNSYSGGQYLVLQNSAGRYYILLWNEQNALALGSSAPVTISFNGGAKSKITDYSLTRSGSNLPQPLTVYNNTSKVVINLTTEVRLLQVDF